MSIYRQTIYTRAFNQCPYTVISQNSASLFNPLLETHPFTQSLLSLHSKNLILPADFPADLPHNGVCCLSARICARRYQIAMPGFGIDRFLRLALLAALAVSACSIGRAQTVEKPDAPALRPGPVAQDLRVISAQAPYRMISGKQRIQWAALETFGPESLLMGTFSAGIGTGRDTPEEYGPHWGGFAKRY